jgi:tRNA (guanine26-N2/guanine27-N2)-dimethyltransferase
VAVRVVREGLVDLELPDDPRLDLAKGPQRAGAMVFYNPAARPSRDLTVALLRALEPPSTGWRVLDGLCGSGVRGLRVAREVDRVVDLVLNDGDPAAAALAQAQVKRLGLGQVRVTHRALEAVLADSTQRFDFIDLDPYGSPVRFLMSAAARCSRQGIVAATATDLAALCGVFAGACLRRYGAVPLRNEWMKETAARILVGAAARLAGCVDRGIQPVATMCTEHYLRVVYRVVKGRQAADRTASQVGFLQPDPAGKESPAVVSTADLMARRKTLSGERPVAGPLWIGDLQDAALLARVEPPDWIDQRGGTLRRFLASAREEAGLPPFFFSLDEAARRARGSPPTTLRAVEALRAHGFAAGPTHFHPKGVKTTASPAELDEVLASVHGSR